jgi:hypothetical protein
MGSAGEAPPGATGSVISRKATGLQSIKGKTPWLPAFMPALEHAINFAPPGGDGY